MRVSTAMNREQFHQWAREKGLTGREVIGRRDNRVSIDTEPANETPDFRLDIQMVYSTGFGNWWSRYEKVRAKYQEWLRELAE